MTGSYTITWDSRWEDQEQDQGHNPTKMWNSVTVSPSFLEVWCWIKVIEVFLQNNMMSQWSWPCWFKIILLPYFILIEICMELNIWILELRQKPNLWGHSDKSTFVPNLNKFPHCVPEIKPSWECDRGTKLDDSPTYSGVPMISRSSWWLQTILDRPKSTILMSPRGELLVSRMFWGWRDVTAPVTHSTHTHTCTVRMDCDSPPSNILSFMDCASVLFMLYHFHGR